MQTGADAPASLCDLSVPARGSFATLPDLNMERTRDRKDRIGALPPRYAFVLNPHADTKFTKCPRCETKTNLRKLSLVIHVDGFGLVTKDPGWRVAKAEDLAALASAVVMMVSLFVFKGPRL